MKTTCRTSRKNQDKKSGEATDNSVGDTCISALHASILVQIFLKLPIGVLMKCKFVCSAWYKIISESSFTEIYERNSPFTTLLLPMVRKRDDLWCQDLYLLEISENGDLIRTLISPLLPRLLPRDMSRYDVGSCSGLLILSMQRKEAEVIYISNPIMGEYVELPVHERDLSNGTSSIYRIGFCPRLNNFKVLRIVFKSWFDSRIEDCEIFTVGVDDRWRRLDFPFRPSRSVNFWGDGVSCNGAFHWILPDNDLFQIFTFDLAEEKIDQLPHPPGLVLNPERMKLALFDKQLTLVDRTDELKITIWTMKEYGIVDSWTKDVILKSCLPSRKRTSIPVGKLQNGDILFGNSGDFMSFNVKQNEFSRIGFFDIPSIAYYIIPYAPSFKSLSKAIMRGHSNTMNNSSKQL